MRIFTILFFVLFAQVVSAQDTEKKEPAALTKARADYDRDILPITKKYVAKLEALKKELGGKGDIEGATAVQAEIDACTPQALSKNPIVGTWKLGPHGIAQFNADGTTSHGGNTGRWTAEGKGAYQIVWGGGTTNKLILITKDKFRTIDSTGREILVTRQ